MCWSGEASAVVAAAGIASGVFCAKRGDSPLLWVPVLYFAGMEALQAFTYTVIDECSSSTNKAATILAYIHICFQPLLINMFALYFVPKFVREKVLYWVYGISLILAALFLMRLAPVDWLRSCLGMYYTIFVCPECRFPIPLCGPEFCAVSGNWHIAWWMPLKFHPLLDNAYLIGGFILPFLYGAWRVNLYLIIVGPILAAFTTDNPNEWPAIWCLFSTIILGIAVHKKLRSYVVSSNYYGWKPEVSNSYKNNSHKK